MKDGFGKVNVTEMAWTLLVAFTAGLTLVIPIERTEARIREAADPWLSSFIFDFGDLDFAHRNGSNLFGTQNTELHLAHGADGCSRVSERLTCLSAHSESDEEGVALEVEAKRAQ